MTTDEIRAEAREQIQWVASRWGNEWREKKAFFESAIALADYMDSHPPLGDAAVDRILELFAYVTYDGDFERMNRDDGIMKLLEAYRE